MLDRARLLALADEASRDPSGSRPLVEQIAAMAAEGMQNGELDCPPGYLYAPGLDWIALAEVVHPEPLPTPTNPQAMPLTSTQNKAVTIKVPWNALVVGVAGWSVLQVPFPSQIAYADRIGLEHLATVDDGRGMFATRWDLNGKTNYSTDGQNELLEPAAVVTGTGRNRRKLAWRVARNQIINVYFRNLSNVLLPVPLVSKTEPGWDIAAAVAFYAINLEDA